MIEEPLTHEKRREVPIARKGWYQDRKIDFRRWRSEATPRNTSVVQQSMESGMFETLIEGHRGLAKVKARTLKIGTADIISTGSISSWALLSRTEATFEELADLWRKETGHLSSITKIIMHPAYQSIIGMGPAVVPFLLRSLQVAPEHWFWALSAITRENPVLTEDAGDIERMADAWIQWAKQKGILF